MSESPRREAGECLALLCTREYAMSCGAHTGSTILIVFSLCGAIGTARGDDPSVARAKEIWQLLAAGQYDAFAATGDDAMKAAFGAKQAEQLMAGLKFQLGAPQAVVS